jgi:hypothetical protein
MTGFYGFLLVSDIGLSRIVLSARSVNITKLIDFTKILYRFSQE